MCRAEAQPRNVEMKTLVSRLRVACHQRSGKYSTWRTHMATVRKPQKHLVSFRSDQTRSFFCSLCVLCRHLVPDGEMFQHFVHSALRQRMIKERTEMSSCTRVWSSGSLPLPVGWCTPAEPRARADGGMFPSPRTAWCGLGGNEAPDQAGRGTIAVWGQQTQWTTRRWNNVICVCSYIRQLRGNASCRGSPSCRRWPQSNQDRASETGLLFQDLHTTQLQSEPQDCCLHVWGVTMKQNYQTPPSFTFYFGLKCIRSLNSAAQTEKVNPSRMLRNLLRNREGLSRDHCDVLSHGLSLTPGESNWSPVSGLVSGRSVWLLCWTKSNLRSRSCTLRWCEAGCTAETRSARTNSATLWSCCLQRNTACLQRRETVISATLWLLFVQMFPCTDWRNMQNLFMPFPLMNPENIYCCNMLLKVYYLLSVDSIKGHCCFAPAHNENFIWKPSNQFEAKIQKNKNYGNKFILNFKNHFQVKQNIFLNKQNWRVLNRNVEWRPHRCRGRLQTEASGKEPRTPEKGRPLEQRVWRLQEKKWDENVCGSDRHSRVLHMRTFPVRVSVSCTEPNAPLPKLLEQTRLGAQWPEFLEQSQFTVVSLFIIQAPLCRSSTLPPNTPSTFTLLYSCTFTFKFECWTFVVVPEW